MFSPSHLKTLHSLQAFSLKSPSSALNYTKLRSFIHTLIISRMCRIIRALSKVKTLILQIFRDNQPIHFHACHKKHYSKNKNKNIILGSFRLHYNWCSSKSSHVLPVPAPVYQGLPSASAASHSYYDSTWNVTSEQQQLQSDQDCPDSQLAGYLQWLEDKLHDDGKQEINEIDMLAEMFIANCHEKFKLEKQESDRRFQEMLARSM